MAQTTDARHAAFNDVGRDQYNQYNFGSREGILQKLEPANMDGSKRTGCLENTGTEMLKLVIQWASDPTSTQRVLWLHGPAGSGKSTISTTLADRFRGLKQLGAFLFFDRDVTERSNPALVVRTLAYQLSLFHPDIGNPIMAVIESSPHTLTSSITSQYQELLIDPLSCIEALPKEPHIVLVLDALDECGTTEDRSTLVNALAEKSAHLPSAFRLVITSRTDIDIQLAFEPHLHVLTLELDLASATINADILTYFQHHLTIIRGKKKYLGKDWPGGKKISTLVRRACGLFVWASIACNFIDAHDPRKRLDIVLQGDVTSTAEVALDTLYRQALECAGAWDDEDFIADFKAIFGIVLFLRNPLTSTGIDDLLANPDGRPSAQTIEQLGCIVSSNPTIRLIHPSLADFFTNRTRCGRDIWFFAPASQERALAILCLRRLNDVLHRDISQLEPLNDKDDKAFPQDVTYACVFWVDHIRVIKDDFPSITELLKTFIDEHVLHWFEAMSFLNRFSLAIILLDQLSEWIQNQRHTSSQQSLAELVRHWSRFAQEYELCFQECPTQVYSQDLLREFQIIEVQEPLVSRSPTQSIFNLPSLSQSSQDISSSQYFMDNPTPQLTSPYLPDLSAGSIPASSGFSRNSWRVSRSSLDLRSRPGSSASGSPSRGLFSRRNSFSSSHASLPASPHQTYGTSPASRCESPDSAGATQCSSSLDIKQTAKKAVRGYAPVGGAHQNGYDRVKAYFLFLESVRSDPALAQEVFGLEMNKIKQSVLAVAKWRSMTDDQRRPFLAQAEQDTLDYEAARRMYYVYERRHLT